MNKAKMQKLVKKTDEIQEQFGGRNPEYIMMYFSYRLEKLTIALIALTAILGILTAVHIILIFI